MYMTSTPKYSIVIPCHNHGRECVGTVQGVMRACAGLPLEIIIVVDGCNDDTEAVVREIAARNERVRVLMQAERLGKGGAVRWGMLVAQGEYVAFIDADNVIDPTFLKQFFAAAEAGHDVVIARRESYDTSLFRYIGSHVYRALNRILFGLPVADTQAGLKVFRRSFVERLFGRLQIRGYAFDIEVLCTAFAHDLRVVDLPVRQTRSKRSNMDGIAIIDAVLDTLDVARRYNFRCRTTTCQQSLRAVLMPCVLVILFFGRLSRRFLWGRRAASNDPMPLEPNVVTRS